MGYTVLARKYRPQKFADLVGQEHVTRTLGNAITTGRVAHAFLFTGARGVGKTSSARLLAKALNCEHGPTAEPCNACDACVQITQGTDMDVLEMDGASNNSVEDVRRLQESLPYRPTRDRFKVVIVDEVHMLSTGAFNAFLKTLEEPPPHVKFIFATTEVHKVPITIRSRCQRHDFRLIPQGVVAGHIREILASEQIDADEEAVHLVAREAAGSMRDALTVLDQLLAFSGNVLDGAAVAAGLGIAGREQIHATAKALLQGDPKGCLRSVHSLSEQGLSVIHFGRQLLQLLRDLVVLKVVGDEGEFTELTPDERSEAMALIADQESAELERTFFGLSELIDTVAQSSNPQLCLEMGLVRLADRPRLRPLSELVAKLDAVLAGAGTTPPPGGAGGGGAAGPGGRGGRPSGRGGSGTSRGSANYTAAAAPGTRLSASADGSCESTRLASVSAVIPGGRVEPEIAAPPPSPSSQAPEPDGPKAAVTATVQRAIGAPAQLPQPPQTAPVLRPHTPETSTNPRSTRQQASLAKITELAAAAAQRASGHHGSAAPDEVSAAPSPADETPAPGVEELRRNLSPKWPELVAKVREVQPALGAILEHGVAREINPERIQLMFPANSFFGRQAQAPAAQAIVRRVAKELLQSDPVLEIRFGSTAEGGTTLAQLDDAHRKERTVRAREAALNHPLVQQAMEIFPESQEHIDVQIQLD